MPRGTRVGTSTSLACGMSVVLVQKRVPAWPAFAALERLKSKHSTIPYVHCAFISRAVTAKSAIQCFTICVHRDT
jgi:hypothetical protein